jgi:hypothetical protein
LATPAFLTTCFTAFCRTDSYMDASMAYPLPS